LAAFEQADPPHRYHDLAKHNLDRWRAQSAVSVSQLRVEVFPGDWGEVTRSLTATYGVCFAVLNMANAYVPGGAYVEGAAAQEENMFRRTDCHFESVTTNTTPIGCHPAMTRLFGSRRRLLETRPPRVCIRGRRIDREPTRYPWLP
jgi:hypothetical protein